MRMEEEVESRAMRRVVELEATGAPNGGGGGEMLSLRCPLVKTARSSGGGRGRVDTNISELPGAVLTSIFSLVTDPRTRNRMALACRDWYYLERQTRSSLTLRGNVCNLLNLPLSFASVTSLDLAYFSPWGYSIFQSTTAGELIFQMLHQAFPNVLDLAVYVRDAIDVQTVACLWPRLEAIRLVRWHQRSTEYGGGVDSVSEVEPLLSCRRLRKMDLSEFYCWNEDVVLALESGIVTAANLRVLNLLKLSSEGFGTHQISSITAICRNLEELFLLCEFDPRFPDPVGNDALQSIGINCPGLRVLHLVDIHAWGAASWDMTDKPAEEDALVSCLSLENMARNLPLLQSLALLLSQNVWDSQPGIEALFAHCRKLTALQLSCFHGLCGWPEDGLATCTNLLELSIKKSVDLSDRSLVSIANDCRKLTKLSLKCCRNISEEGLHTCVRALSHTLVDVEIFGCQRVDSVETLRALEPIRNSIRRLHFDCNWDDTIVAQQAAAVAAAGNRGSTARPKVELQEDGLPRCTTVNVKRGTRNIWASANEGPQMLLTAREGGAESNVMARNGPPNRIGEASGSGGRGLTYSFVYSSPPHDPDAEAPDQRCWKSLQTLSLWMNVGLLMSPLPSMGLGRCPALTEVTIKVEGDCKERKRPVVSEWGLGTLSRYEKFTKLNLDLGEVVSFSHSAPEGQCDLSIWERHYLSGIAELNLLDLDYRPPCDKDSNHRGLSLPAVAHLSQCQLIRKLIVHGSAHAHFLSMLQRNTSLRDFQLRWDYYPAPDSETANEVRVDACRRFEEALAERGLSD